MATAFCELTGVTENEAQMWLEMAGGDLDTAVSLFFQNMDTMGAAMQVDDASGYAGADLPVATSYPPWYTLVWPGKSPIAPCWLEQPLLERQDPAANPSYPPWLVLQKKNGPCGVLAAVQAALIASNWDILGPGAPALTLDFDGLCGLLSKVVTAMLCRAAPPGGAVRVCRWLADVGAEVSIKEMPAESAGLFVAEHIADFANAGGCVLLVYSLVLTRGEDLIKADIGREGGEPPLIVGPNLLCSSELVSLCLRGVAGGNVGAFAGDGSCFNWPLDTEFGVGLLSHLEVESGIPLCDALKFPRVPVWLCHGGDHFTVLFKGDGDATSFQVHLWNGLPPGGPRLAQLKLKAPRGDAAVAPTEPMKSYWKPEVGEIEDIIQAHPDDKKSKPKEPETWRFEVALAIVKEDVSDSGAPRNLETHPVLKFELKPVSEGEAWRCRSCYETRFQTMCFGINEPGAVSCQHCAKPQAECGWTLWLHHSELPRNVQERVRLRYAPKLLAVLHTRWPMAEALAEDGDQSLPSV